jgi:Mg-chelatase subunit ChlD
MFDDSRPLTSGFTKALAREAARIRNNSLECAALSQSNHPLPGSVGGVVQSRPQWTGVIYGLLDVSASMAERDFSPSRIEAAKEALLAFARRRGQDRPNDWLSVLSFNSAARLLYQSVRLGDSEAVSQLHQMFSGLQASGGTDLSAPLDETITIVRLIHRYFPDFGKSYGILRVLCLTDGHSSGDPLRSAGILKEQGVVIEIVGMGGSPSDVNEGLLKQCASIENGRLLYRFIGDQGGGADRLVKYFTEIALS